MVAFSFSIDWLLDILSPSVLCGAGGVVTIGVIGGLDWFLFNSPRRKNRNKGQRLMKGVVITSYRGIKGIQVKENLPIPHVLDNDDVLIKVIAAGLDPIDLKISRGYGETIRSHLRHYNKRADEKFPIILGRQCSGIVLNCGRDVDSVSEGQAVIAVSAYCHDGLAAEYVVVKEEQTALKPKNLTFEESASFPYPAIKIWNALVKQADMKPKSMKGKRILVHAGNSPIGLLAIQFSKVWGAHVTTTVPTVGLPMCHVLGVDDAIVYSVTDYEAELRMRKRFDVVLNTVGLIIHQLCVDFCNSGGKVITLISTPVITDKFGLVKGTLLALVLQIVAWIKKIKHGTTFQFWWDNFSYDKESLKALSTIIEEEKIHPIVETVFDISQAPMAFQQLALHNTVGSTVLKLVWSSNHLILK